MQPDPPTPTPIFHLQPPISLHLYSYSNDQYIAAVNLYINLYMLSSDQ